MLIKRLFVKMAVTDNAGYLLPAKRDSEIISSFRTAKEYPLMWAKSTGFKNCSSHMLSQTSNDSLDVIHCVVFFSHCVKFLVVCMF